MNWMIIAIVLGLLVAGAIVVANVTTANATEKIPCSSCGGKCSADANCGQATCGALSGGSCGCGGRG